MKLAVVGATGMVGTKMLEVLAERNFPYSELYLVASEKSAGKEVTYSGKTYTLISPKELVAIAPDLALFSAGGNTSLEWAPQLAAVGTTVIDNSSAWRMHPEYKLIVPEVNGHLIAKSDKIIANPNCSTIQLVVVLEALNRIVPIKRVVVSTYQSVTGTGIKAVKQLLDERAGIDGEKAYPYAIDMNLLPHIDVFLENGNTKEEQKIIDETKKIMNLPNLKITSTAVRVPVMGGHSESVNIEFESDLSPEKAREILVKAPGVKLLDNPAENKYPMPLLSQNNDPVWVGRIRRDESAPNALNLWIVADNLRKGAATNAIQIAEIWGNL